MNRFIYSLFFASSTLKFYDVFSAGLLLCFGKFHIESYFLEHIIEDVMILLKIFLILTMNAYVIGMTLVIFSIFDT